MLSGVLGALLFAGVATQVGATDPAQEFFSERPPEYLDSVEVYLQMKSEEFAATAALLERVRLHQHVDAFYGLVESSALFSSYNLVGDSTEQRALVAQALGLTAAQYLASVGTTMKKVAASNNVGLDPVRGAVKIVAGGAEFEDLAAVGEVMLLGSVEGVENSAAGDVISIRVTDGSSDLGSRSVKFLARRSSVSAGQECMFFVSRALSAVHNARGASAPSPIRLAQQFAPFCSSESGYVSTNPYVTGAVSAPTALGLLAAKKLASDAL